MKTRALLYTKPNKVRKYRIGDTFGSVPQIGAPVKETPKRDWTKMGYNSQTGKFNANKGDGSFAQSTGVKFPKFDTNIQSNPILEQPKQFGQNRDLGAFNTAMTGNSRLKVNQVESLPMIGVKNVAGGFSGPDPNNPPPLMNRRLKPSADPKLKIDGSKLGDTVAPLVGQAGVALSQTSDGDATTLTDKEKVGTVAGSSLATAASGYSLASSLVSSGLLTTAAAAPVAATVAGTAAPAVASAAAIGGVAVPVIGAAIGAAIGLAIGFLKKGKAKRAARKAKREQNVKLGEQTAAQQKADLGAMDSRLLSGVRDAGSQQTENAGYRTGHYKEGGTFYYKLPELTTREEFLKKNFQPKKFKRGGSIKPTENIIPNGVLHEEKNELGDKGMPVVKCKNNTCKKQYEIERDELIFTLPTTKQIEKLAKEKDYTTLGEFVKEQLLNNTHSFTSKFVDLNDYTKEDGTIYA